MLIRFLEKGMLMYTLLSSCIVLLSMSSFSYADTVASKNKLKIVNNASSQTTAINEVDKNSLVVPFTAKYSILHKSKEVGFAVRQLEKLDGVNYKYSYKTDIEWLIFDDRRAEESLITLSNNKVTPVHYKSSREGTGRDKYYEWSYNIAQNTAKNIKKDKTVTVNYPANIQDSLSYHLQHRLNLIKNPNQKEFTYNVIKSSGYISEYEYKYDGTEDIMLPYGLVKTIKLKREVKEKERVTYAWFAPELNYLLVRLYQTKGGTEQFEAQLTDINSTQ